MVLRRVSCLALTSLFVVGTALVACSGSDGGGGGGGSDAATGEGGGEGTGDGGSGGTGDGGGGGTTDSGGAKDSGGDGGGGNVQFGQACQTANQQSNCAAGLTCRNYPNKSMNLCTKPCPNGNSDCPAPSNKCGGAGYCAFP